MRRSSVSPKNSYRESTISSRGWRYAVVSVLSLVAGGASNHFLNSGSVEHLEGAHELTKAELAKSVRLSESLEKQKAVLEARLRAKSSLKGGCEDELKECKEGLRAVDAFWTNQLANQIGQRDAGKEGDVLDQCHDIKTERNRSDLLTRLTSMGITDESDIEAVLSKTEEGYVDIYQVSKEERSIDLRIISENRGVSFSSVELRGELGEVPSDILDNREQMKLDRTDDERAFADLVEEDGFDEAIGELDFSTWGLPEESDGSPYSQARFSQLRDDFLDPSTSKTDKALAFCRFQIDRMNHDEKPLRFSEDGELQNDGYMPDQRLGMLIDGLSVGTGVDDLTDCTRIMNMACFSDDTK